MKISIFRKATALFLTLVILMTCMSAWSEPETSTVNVDATTEDQEVTVDAIKVIEVTPEYDRTLGLDIVTDGHDADVDVEKGIIVQGENNPGKTTYGTIGVLVDALGDGSGVDLEIGEEGLTVGDSHNAIGMSISLNAQQDNSAEITVDGPVTVSVPEDTGMNGNATGLSIDLGGAADTDVEVEIAGDLTVNGNTDARGISFGTALIPDTGNTANVHVEGDLTARTQETGAVYDSAQAIQAEGICGEETITVDGSINAEGVSKAEAVGVWATSEEDRITISAGKDITAESENADAVAVTVDNRAGDTEIKAGGTIQATTGKGLAQAVDVKAEQEAAVTVTAGGDVTAENTNTIEGNAVGIAAKISDTGSLTVHVGGGVKATTAAEEGRGSGVILNLGGGSAEAEIGGDVEANGLGIQVYQNPKAENSGITSQTEADAALKKLPEGYKPGKYTVMIGGAPTTIVTYYFHDQETGTAYSIQTREDGTLFSGSKTEYSELEAKAAVQVNGNLTVEGGGKYADATAVDARSENRVSETEITVDGNVSAAGERFVNAVSATSNGGTIRVKTGGDISAIASDTAEAIRTNASNGGEILINVEGAVCASSDTEDPHFGATGIAAIVYGADSSTEITVEKGVTAEASANADLAYGIYTRNETDEKHMGGVIDIRIADNVESTGTGIWVQGSDKDFLDGSAEVRDEEYVRSDYNLNEIGEYEEEKIYYNEEGGYFYNESGFKWKKEEAEGGLTRIEVRGDVTGGTTGLEMGGVVPADVIIDGTLEGGEHAVILSEENVADNMTLTVWAIRPNADGSVAEFGHIGADGELETTEATDFEKEIQYIIRLEQPNAGAMLSTLGTYEYEGYNVAHEGDTVILKVNLEHGYEIVDAFNGTDTRVSLLQDADGNYYLVVPRGGAVLLSVKLRKLPVSSVTIDPNGGMLRGKTEPYSFEALRNGRIVLPEAPAKEGETFLGWYGTEYPATDARWNAPAEGSAELLQAKSWVKVTQDRYYTAVWKKAE